MLDLLILLTSGDPSPTEAAGRLDYVVARCATFGWAADEAARLARLDDLAAEQPSRPREAIVREFARGTRHAFSREGEIVEGVRSREDRVRWARDVEHLCDRVADDHPKLLRRTPETAERWAALLEAEDF